MATIDSFVELAILLNFGFTHAKYEDWSGLFQMRKEKYKTFKEYLLDNKAKIAASPHDDVNTHMISKEATKFRFIWQV